MSERNTYTAPIRKVGEVEKIAYTKDGEERTFEKRTLVLEDDDRFNDCIAFELGGKTLDLAEGYKVGDLVAVSYNISCRENRNKPGQFFTSLKAWRIEAPATKTPGSDEHRDVTKDEIPF